ncbi:MAG: hypothetical protein P8L32_07815 [Paracoccaceae bacterium]|nr:hypothetical protein [Paracoccaceae bacterium]
MDLEFHDDETVTMTTFMSFSKDAFEMMGATEGDGGMCDGAETIVSETDVTCVQTETLSLQAAISNGLTAGDKNSGQGMNAAIRRINDNVLAISLPIETSGSPVGAEGSDPDMEAAFLESFKGQNFKIWVTGKKILASNGFVTEEGRSTVLSLTMVELMQGADIVPESFEVVFEYR